MDFETDNEPTYEQERLNVNHNYNTAEFMRMILQLKREIKQLKELNSELEMKCEYIEEHAEIREAELLAAVKDLFEEEGVGFDIDDFLEGI